MSHGTQAQAIKPQGGATSTPSRLLYSYKEARELLGGVSVSTFGGWIAQGLVTPVRIGPRRCFVTHEDLMALAAKDPSRG